MAAQSIESEIDFEWWSCDHTLPCLVGVTFFHRGGRVTYSPPCRMATHVPGLSGGVGIRDGVTGLRQNTLIHSITHPDHLQTDESRTMV